MIFCLEISLVSTSAVHDRVSSQTNSLACFDSTINPALSTTNIPPTDIEANLLRGLMHQELREMVHLEAKPSKLLEKEQIQARIDSYRLALSPARLLPPELVSEIFLLSSPLETIFPLDPMDPRLTLSHICSGWRQVALGTRKLWSDVSIEPPKGADMLLHPRPVIEPTKTWFDRAHPISLALQVGRDTYPSQHGPQIDEIVSELLIPYAHRFRALKLFATSTFYRSFFHLLSPGLTSIESLLVGSLNLERSEDSFMALHTAPGLRRLTLESLGVALDLTPYRLGIPWHQLSYLSLEDMWISVAEAHDIFRQCTNLVECTFEYYLDQSLDKTDSEIVLLNLCKLKIRLRNEWFPQASQVLDKFFCPLVLPALKNFKVKSDAPFDFQSSDPPLTSLLSRSGSRLECLCIPSIDMTGIAIRTLLKLSPSLMRLNLMWGLDEYGLETIRMMSRNELVPELNSVSFENLRYTNEEQRSPFYPVPIIIAFIESRLDFDAQERSRVTLKKVLHRLYPDMGPLERFKENGIDIVYSPRRYNYSQRSGPLLPSCPCAYVYSCFGSLLEEDASRVTDQNSEILSIYSQITRPRSLHHCVLGNTMCSMNSSALICVLRRKWTSSVLGLVDLARCAKNIHSHK